MLSSRVQYRQQAKADDLYFSPEQHLNTDPLTVVQHVSLLRYEVHTVGKRMSLFVAWPLSSSEAEPVL